MSAEVTLTSANFDTEVLKSPIPVLVDFWADWCMPCKMIAPVIEEVANAYKTKAKVGKVNVDQQRELASKYGISSIPSLLIFKDGKLVKQQTGAVPRSDIEALLKPYL
ncbi:MAG: thioredoxin [Spirochaetaceae bacterium]|jgi:thioredoxin 1|nr:thioredoxin [Spirochaetaceae bacterium]